jgi:long-chain acyl-CoA synthetase
MTGTLSLSDSDTAARIFFDQAARPELRDRPRCMVPMAGGGWCPVTWGEMAVRIERLAAFLIGRGVTVEAKVAVLADTRLEWALAGIAALAARGVLVPVYPTLVGEPLAHVLAHSDSRVLFVESAEQLRRVLPIRDRLALDTLVVIEPLDLAALVQEAGIDPGALVDRVFSLDEAEARGAAALVRDPGLVRSRLDTIGLDDIGSLIYTSGTTGLPKGVLLSHRNVAVSAADWISLNGPALGEGDVDILWLPMSHIFGWGQFGLGNQLGFLTYFSDPARALTHLRELSPQVFMSVPVYWDKLALAARAAGQGDEALAELRRLTGGKLRFCLSGGAGLAREVKELFRSAGMFIVEGYGLTECSPTLTMNRRDDYDFDSVGKPYPNVRLKIADDGEILAKGENVFSGYYKDAAATAAAFDAEGWFKTGDLGRFNERGFLQIIGRKKEIIVTSGGKNVPPENIERCFRDDPLISRVVVYGDGRKYLTAIVDVDDDAARRLLADAGESSVGALRAHPLVLQSIQRRVDAVNAGLARYETIKRFHVADEPLTLESGQLTPSLKVKRAAVYERYQGALDALYQA